MHRARVLGVAAALLALGAAAAAVVALRTRTPSTHAADHGGASWALHSWVRTPGGAHPWLSTPDTSTDPVLQHRIDDLAAARVLAGPPHDLPLCGTAAAAMEAEPLPPDEVRVHALYRSIVASASAGTRERLAFHASPLIRAYFASEQPASDAALSRRASLLLDDTCVPRGTTHGGAGLCVTVAHQAALGICRAAGDAPDAVGDIVLDPVFGPARADILGCLRTLGGEVAVPGLEDRLLRGGDDTVVLALLQARWRRTPEDVGRFLPLLRHASERVRTAALVAIPWAHASADAMLALAASTRDEDPGVRAAAVRAYGKHGTPADAVLLVALGDRAGPVRVAALEVSAPPGPARLSRMRALLDDPDASVRAAALRSVLPWSLPDAPSLARLDAVVAADPDVQRRSFLARDVSALRARAAGSP